MTIPEKIIRPETNLFRLNLDEIWRHRELLGMLVWRSIAIRYRQMVLGPLWVVLEPVVMVAIMAFVFGTVLKLPTDGYPYPVFVFSALIPFLLFSKTTVSVTDSLRENMAVISKVYFPRLLLPLTSTVRELFDASVSIVVVLAVAWAYGFAPSYKLLLLPAFALISVCAALALGLMLATVVVRFRDVRHALTIALQLWLYATPVVYSSSVVPASYLPIFKLNPVYWSVEGFRWALLDKPLVLDGYFLISMGATAVILVAGVLVFSYYERLTIDTQ